MEDAATAEIARCQIWQWLDHATPLANDGTVTDELVRSSLAEELARRKVDRDSDGRERAGAGRANRRGHRARGGSASLLHHRRICSVSRPGSGIQRVGLLSSRPIGCRVGPRTFPTPTSAAPPLGRGRCRQRWPPPVPGGS
ncbi:hypothetical protein [Micromonospora tulbaghiae]|uniref:hypothetical protein n=1 Tax=Micromonospora tulbaghiae TaxID=479978 RepID=UPI003083F669